MRSLDLPRTAESLFRRTRRSLHRGTPAVVLMLILVGCGGGTAAPAAATPTQPQATAAGVPTVGPTSAATAGSASVEACDFLTPDEVSTIVGMSRPLPVPSSDANYAYCKYSTPGAPELMIFVTKSAENAANQFNTAKLNGGEAVSGVGDQAFWSTDSFLPGLYFMKGGTMAYISGSSSGPQAPIIQLGKLLASRM